MDYTMSLKFGLDWKKHDAKRIQGIMAAMTEAEMPIPKKSNANGRDKFR